MSPINVIKTPIKQEPTNVATITIGKDKFMIAEPPMAKAANTIAIPIQITAKPNVPIFLC
ncbi:hypothetical protein D9M71_702740 [compost metagenome]